MATAQHCLFDAWSERSVRSFHTSTLWPGFDEAAIQDFLAGKGDSPMATTPGNLKRAQEFQASIQSFLDYIESLGDDAPVCAPVYREYEEERLAGITAIIGAIEGRPVDAQLDLLWGRPESMRGEEALAWLKADVEALKPSAPQTAAARTRLLELWADVEGSQRLGVVFEALEAHRLALAPIVRQRHPYLPELLSALPKRDVTSEEAAAFLAAGMERILPAGSGWTVEVRPEAPNIFNDNGHRCLVVPAGRTYSHDRLEALLVHEVGVHDLRAVNGYNSAERLASVGMAGYGHGEEAFGTLYGGAGKANRNFSYDVLAFGVFDLASRPGISTFRDIHNRVADLMVCLANPKPESAEADIKTIRRAAFSRVIRTCRMGTPVIVDRSISKYWRGMNVIHEYLTERGITPKTVEEFLRGKYDCQNPDHLSLVTNHTLATSGN